VAIVAPGSTCAGAPQLGQLLAPDIRAHQDSAAGARRASPPGVGALLAPGGVGSVKAMPVGLGRLLVRDTAGAVAINVLLNGGWAVYAYRDLAEVDLWGPRGFALDTAATALLLPLVTCLLLTPAARYSRARLRIPPLDRAPRGLGWLPRGTLLRSVVAGLACAALFAPLVICPLEAAQVGAMSFAAFVAAKTGFAAGLGALVTPLLALRAFADPDERVGITPPAWAQFVFDLRFLLVEGAIYFVSLTPPVLVLWALRDAHPAVLLAGFLVCWPLAALVFVVTLACIKTGFIGDVPTGRFFWLGDRAGKWVAADRLLKIAQRSPFQGLINDSALYRFLYYRGMGARIATSAMLGRRVTINEPWLVEIRGNALVGDEAILTGHKVEKDVLTLGRITIGSGVTIGARALIFPGVTVGDRAVVGAQSVVVRGTVIPPGETWAGSPARKVEALGALELQARRK
jgi:acetyltransferase-like isoleucine patch superfamily enzyme